MDEISRFLQYYIPKEQFQIELKEDVFQITIRGKSKAIQIYPDWWRYRRRAVENHLIVKTGKSELLHGRETNVKRISTEEAKELFETTHLAGYLKSKVKLGLFHYSELVMCATFANPRKWERNNALFVSAEMVGLCSGYGLAIRGGAEKLLSHYIEQFSPDEVITFSDNSFSEGDLFRNIGFQKAGEKPPMGFVVDAGGKRKYTNHNPEYVNDGYTKWVLDVKKLNHGN